MTDTLTAPSDERALATIETILSVRPIPDADAIECVRIRGWDVVTRKGEFASGDKVLYIEVDSFLDVTDPRFEFLAPRGIRHDETGRGGHVVKTARLRGQYSQGIVFALSAFPELSQAQVGDDVTGQLGIVKWDPPVPADMAGVARGFIPSWIRKTDEERIQNLSGIPGAGLDGWVATEKIDGTSMSVWVDVDDEGVSGRNYDIVRSEGNSMWATALKLDLHRQLREAFPGVRATIQGELFGPGIQGNPLQVKQVTFAAFTMIVDGQEIPRSQWPQFALNTSVPLYNFSYPATIEEAVEQVKDLKSLVNPSRAAEGVVWRNLTRAQVTVNGRSERASFKSISAHYLLKHDR